MEVGCQSIENSRLQPVSSSIKIRTYRCLKFVLQIFSINPFSSLSFHILLHLFLSLLSLFMLVALLHFILIIAPHGILFTFIPFPYNTSTHIPTIYVYSYSTLVPGLIPSQSSFPSTFSTLGLTHICTSYLTPIPKCSSHSNQAEPFFFHLYQRLHYVQTMLLTYIDY